MDSDDDAMTVEFDWKRFRNDDSVMTELISSSSDGSIVSSSTSDDELILSDIPELVDNEPMTSTWVSDSNRTLAAMTNSPEKQTDSNAQTRETLIDLTPASDEGPIYRCARYELRSATRRNSSQMELQQRKRKNVAKLNENSSNKKMHRN